MPAIIRGGMLNTNTAQLNAGVFVGQYNFGSWDSNAKITKGCASQFGFGNIVWGSVSFGFDNFEIVDGAMFDADFKPQFSGNV